MSTHILINTGANRSCISENLFHRTCARQKIAPLLHSPTSTKLLSANGSPLQVIGQADLDIRINNYGIMQSFVVFRKLQHACIFGIDMLNTCRAVIKVHEQTLSLFDDLIVTQLITDQDHCNILPVTNQTRIPAHAEAIVSVT